MIPDSTTYDLIVIGGGPAGISAGIYAARKKLKTLLLAKNLGGQPNEAGQIDNYLGLPAVSGIELVEKFRNHLEKFKADIEIKEGSSVVEIRKIELAENNFPLFAVYH